MADILSKAERSERMARVRPHANRTTELALREALRRSKVSGWRRHSRLSLRIKRRDGRPSGRHARPDFVFSRGRVAVFVDGCFWHACPRHRTTPASNRAYWEQKLKGNRKRDREVTRALVKQGWTVIRIWEHDVKKRLCHCVRRVQTALRTRRSLA